MSKTKDTTNKSDHYSFLLFRYNTIITIANTAFVTMSSVTSKATSPTSTTDIDPTKTKRAKTTSETTSEVVKEKTPYETYFEQRNAWLNMEEHKDFLGFLMIRGVEKNNDHSDDSEEEDSDEEETEAAKAKYTTEEMNSTRWIMINKSRDQCLDDMSKLILKDQADSSFMMFSTSYSYDVLYSFEYLKKRVLARKSPSQKLDILIAYTHTLFEHDVWMHDNEGDMGAFVKGLAAQWKKLLKNSDEALGWDLEYTKPGVMALLEMFQERIHGMGEEYELGRFNYM